MMKEYKHIISIHKNKPIAHVKQWVVWEEIYGPSPEIPINVEED